MNEEKSLIYLYCVTDKMPKLSSLRIEREAGSPQPLYGMAKEATKSSNAGVYFVYHQGFYAVISKVSEDEFAAENLKKNLADLEWIKQKASIHERVIEEVMKDICLIPFKFATLFNNEDNLKAMMEEYKEEFKNKLNDLEGKEEWGLKIYCDIEKLKVVLSQENDDEISQVDKEISFSSVGKAFLLKKKKEELIKEAIFKRINECSKSCFEELKGKALDARINRLLPKEVTERIDEMILNAAFLVDKNKIREFVVTVDNLRVRYADKGINFDCTGPWPAYNFCNLKEKR